MIENKSKKDQIKDKFDKKLTHMLIYIIEMAMILRMMELVFCIIMYGVTALLAIFTEENQVQPITI